MLRNDSRGRTAVLILIAAIAVSCGRRDEPTDALILATTTSTYDSGLLDVLAPRFEREHGIGIKVIAVGTGAALRMASSGDADAVLTHAPEAEQKYVAAGDLIEGRLIMRNDFVIVGPADDPARVGGSRSAPAAMRAIANRALFLSRGDDSGTHVKELELWRAAGLAPESVARRENTGQGMGATLYIADQLGGYTLTDRGTYLALKRRLDLIILFEGDPRLANIYHAYVVNPAKHPRTKADAGRAFVEFLASPAVQQLIGEFKREEYGEPLFVPAAPAREPVKGPGGV